jgi:hypothetical protein
MEQCITSPIGLWECCLGVGAGVLFLLRDRFGVLFIMPFKQVSDLLGLLQFTSMFQFYKLYIPHLLLEWGTTGLPYLITDFRIAPHIQIFVREFGALGQIVTEYCSTSVISPFTSARLKNQTEKTITRVSVPAPYTDPVKLVYFCPHSGTTLKLRKVLLIGTSKQPVLGSRSTNQLQCQPLKNNLTAATHI